MKTIEKASLDMVDYVYKYEEVEFEDRKLISISRTYYPLRRQGWGNHVKNVIEISSSKAGYLVEVYERADNWNGTYSRMLAEIKLTEKEYEELKNKTKMLAGFIKEGKYEETGNIFGEIEDFIEELVEEKERMLNEAFENIIDEFLALDEVAFKLELLHDKEEREKIKEHLRECLESYLS